jgi:hypothetical protein
MTVSSKRGGIRMRECFCSIFDTREERLIEEDGRVIHRLICNVCGRVLDSKVEIEQDELRSYSARNKSDGGTGGALETETV